MRQFYCNWQAAAGDAVDAVKFFTQFFDPADNLRNVVFKIGPRVMLDLSFLIFAEEDG